MVSSQIVGDFIIFQISIQKNIQGDSSEIYISSCKLIMTLVFGLYVVIPI